MREDLIAALRAYLAGTLSLDALNAEVSSFDWSDRSAEALVLRPTVGALELAITEATEGMIGLGALADVIKAQLLTLDPPTVCPTLTSRAGTGSVVIVLSDARAARARLTIDLATDTPLVERVMTPPGPRVAAQVQRTRSLPAPTSGWSRLAAPQTSGRPAVAPPYAARFVR